MAKPNSGSHNFALPSPTRQIAFHQLLLAARQTVLADALKDALAKIEIAKVKDEILALVKPEPLRLLAAAGIRDEYVFPTPIVLRAKPTLVGYYRLLLGISQKAFYTGSTGMGCLHSMETKGTLTSKQDQRVPEFCECMCSVLTDLVLQISPTITLRDVADLQLLTLGSQFQGGNNNSIGIQATTDIFLAIADLVESHTIEKDKKSILVKNASKRQVRIVLAADPDVVIQERTDDNWHNSVAIEIKGGSDKSNAHNRAGEAEKSHRKAKASGFIQFWTIIAKRGLDLSLLEQESPTTTAWFDVAQLLARKGQDWNDFQNKLARALGIPIH